MEWVCIAPVLMVIGGHGHFLNSGKVNKALQSFLRETQQTMSKSYEVRKKAAAAAPAAAAAARHQGIQTVCDLTARSATHRSEPASQGRSTPVSWGSPFHRTTTH